MQSNKSKVERMADAAAEGVAVMDIAPEAQVSFLSLPIPCVTNSDFSGGNRSFFNVNLCT